MMALHRVNIDYQTEDGNPGTASYAIDAIDAFAAIDQGEQRAKADRRRRVGKIEAGSASLVMGVVMEGPPKTRPAELREYVVTAHYIAKLRVTVRARSPNQAIERATAKVLRGGRREPILFDNPILKGDFHGED